jgi:hypothetical protein
MTQPCEPTAGGLCRSLAEAAVHARRPFMPDLVQAKIHSIDRDGRFADVAFYIDARAVMDRLNVLLPGRWHAVYELVDRRQGEDAEELLVYRCHLTVAEATYTDVGEGPDHKAAQSDALKRAAVHVGIGHCVYRIEGPRMFPGEGPHELRRTRRGRFYLDEANRVWLRGRYRAWLIEHGVAEYGLPLDHGAAARALAPELFPARFARPNPHGTPPGSATANGNGTASRQANGTGARAEPAASPNRAAPAANGATPAAEPRRDSRKGAAEPSTPAPTHTPQRSPAPVDPRVMLLDAAARHGYRRETVLALAPVVAATPFDRIDAVGLRDLLAFLDSAAAGHVDDGDLTVKLDELAASGERGEARERLAVWLLDREERAAAAP